MKFLARTLLTTAASITPALATPCYAQAAGAPETAATENPNQTSLAAVDANATVAAGDGDIVVTAQRRSENLQRVPIVVTVVSAEQLSSSGITSLQQINLLTPGLNSRQNTGAFQPTIRGIGTSSIVVENPVALYIDGVYLPQQREGLRELPDVEQVTVLKGPQGTLFGRNATAGVIQITTRQPTQEFEFRAEAGIDNYATIHGSAYVAGGLANGVAASLSVQYSQQGEGYGLNRVTGNDAYRLLHSFMTRGKIVLDPGPNTRITLIGDYMDRAARNQDIQPYPGTSFTLPLSRPVQSPYDISTWIDPETTYRGGGVSLTAEQNFDFAKLVSISAYRRGKATFQFDVVPTGTPFFDVIAPNDFNNSFTQEVQLLSQGNSHFTWAVGAYYFHSVNATSPISRFTRPAFYGVAVPAPTAGFRADTFGKETTESFAPYGQVGIEFLPNTTLTLGGRYTFESRNLEGHVVRQLYNGNIVNVPPVTGHQSIGDPTWRVALDHRFTGDIMGYVSYNRGIKSGGYNISNVASAPYLPERLDAYEMGLRTRLLDRRLRLNVGAFYYNYSNIQVVQFAGATQIVTNGAAARLYGLDVDFDANLSDELRLSGGFEILHAVFTDYVNAVGSIPKPAGGATLTTVNATGNRLPGSQEFVATAALDYRKVLPLGVISFNLTGNYNGDYFFEADNFARQGSYLMLNSALTWTSSDEHLSISIWGRNLLNEVVATNVATTAFGYLALYGTAPRTYGVTGRVNF